MDIKWIHTFIIAAQCENLRQASEKLYLTQPAVTKHIQKLEQLIGTSLFTRKGKTIALNVEGHRFLPIAKTIIQQYEKGLCEFDAWRSGYLKRLTIATAPQIASSILPTILKNFLMHEPSIDVQINVINSYDVIESILKGQADIGLTRTQIIHSTLSCENILEDPVILVAPFQTDCIEQTIFQHYRLLTHNHPMYWEDLLYTVKQVYPSVQTMPINQIEVTKKFIEQGLGVSYLPLSMVEKELQTKLFKQILPVKISLPLSNTYVVTKVQTEETTSFIRFLKQEIEKSTYKNA